MFRRISALICSLWCHGVFFVDNVAGYRRWILYPHGRNHVPNAYLDVKLDVFLGVLIYAATIVRCGARVAFLVCTWRLERRVGGFCRACVWRVYHP